MIEGLFHLYDEVLGVSKHQFVREYNSVHIVCGGAAAGTLRVGLGHENKVIGFPDFFAVGPIWKLHSDDGWKHRYRWLKDHLNIEMDYMEEEYEQRFMNTLEEIKAIPGNLPIVLWTAENADEQTGMRYILNLLSEKTNVVFLINSTTSYKELYDTEEYQYFCLHTGEVVPEKLKEIDAVKRIDPLTAEDRKKYVEEWAVLEETKEVLRIWENGKIASVSENYYDQLIIDSAQRLHNEQEQYEFMLSARIIGDVLGHLEERVSDSFLEYRLRTLIYNGVFDIKGVPKGMRYYRVKLK
ncbi:DUF1835 domain-containing protein [Siminovitchia acidinfaciens]|uniref:DUF1835 domain-containing protein n=2 Tax=Siminovitchia acidinfaciens TaxID=2321395 RepID=A0A429Y569_9BACI|nr:DUF1835 domain-containing protein [Siminovitchia acidinfaciens]